MYYHTFTADQLEDDILPQLLLGKILCFAPVNQFVKIVHNCKTIKFHCMFMIGIRDSNDEVVAATLRALADIVPALGATTVKKDLFFILDPAFL